ncbi:MAG: hypothetical protein JOZ81_30515 [Chloroflexi bacterium]|nr:hypothetical protein [Chloroflexota bacterium]
MVRFRRRLLTVLVPLTVLAVLAAASVLWLEQQSARARVAEAELQPALERAVAAEARAARAEASLTAIAIAIADQKQADVAATATAVAQANEPERGLEHALGQLFGVYQDPSGPAYDQLTRAFSPEALQVVRAEADYLRGNGQHLGGVSTFTVEPSPLTQLEPDVAEVQTTERWVYDERDHSDNRVRCFVEDSDQTYQLRHAEQGWIVDQIQLGSTHRSDCPSG